MAFENAILRFKVRFFGIKGVKKRLTKLKKKLRGDFSPVARRIVTQLLKEADKPFADSARGNPPKRWKRLAALTVFVRMHRAVRKNKDPKIMVDRGILRASNVPFMRKLGREFGIENRHPAAKVLHDGGVSKSNTASIGRFRRKSKKGKVSRVSPYKMSIKGGNRIPARPWMPTKKRVITILRFILGDFKKELAKT